MKRKLEALLAVAALGLAGLAVVEACGTNFAVAVFHYSRHPELPRSRFLNGDLGIIQPTWARSYFVISWRYLTGVGLDGREKQQAADYYKDRDTGWWDRTGTDWERRWEQVRARVAGMPAIKKRLLTEGKYAWNTSANTFELNCAEDAFRTAANTLESRIGAFGVRSRAVREWTLAQNQVFSNCDGTAASIPSPAPADFPAQIRDDRRYQIAAAHFYSGAPKEALKEFAAIAHDPKSAWASISRYLVLRTMLRMTPIPQAEFMSEAGAVLADVKLLPIHSMTLNLLDRYDLRVDGDNSLTRFATLVSSRGQGNGLREGLWNYTTEYDNVIGDASPNAIYVKPGTPKADPKPFETNEMTAWIFHYQSRDAASGKVALERWKRRRSLPWLLAALRHADSASAQRDGLLEAAHTVAPDSPAYETAAWHYYRLLIDAKAKEEAREGLDAILASGKLGKSSLNLFRGLRMSAAADLTDFFRFAAHQPVLLSSELDYAQTPNRYDPESWGQSYLDSLNPKSERLGEAAAEAINNQMPLRMVRDLALSETVSGALRRELLLVSLTRALLLNGDMTVLAGKLGETDPALSERVQTILNAESPDAARFAAAHMLLWQLEARPWVAPGISRQTANGRLDDFRDNWWCPVTQDDPTSQRGVPEIAFRYYDAPPVKPLFPPQPPSFLSPEDLEEAAKERKALIATGRAMDFLGAIVLEWAKTHPEDPRVPEALHREIRGARINCDGERKSKINREVFRLLKTRYRNTTWARRTSVR